MICHLDVVFCSLRASQNFQNENDITWLLNTLLYTEYDTEYFTVQTTGSTVSQYTKIQQLIFLLFLFPNHKNRTQPQLPITTHHRQRLNNYSNNNNYNYTRWQKQSHHISSISTSLLLEPDTASLMLSVSLKTVGCLCKDSIMMHNNNNNKTTHHNTTTCHINTSL